MEGLHARTQFLRPARPAEARRVPIPPAAARAQAAGQQAIYYGFIVMIFTLTVLQKFGLPAAGTVASFSVIGMYGVHAYLILRGVLRLNMVRLVLYALFLTSALISQFFASQPPSFPSLLLVSVIYFACCFEVVPTQETYFRCMRFFQNAMLVAGGLTLLQHAIQLIWSADKWLNLDELIPPAFRYVQFVYLQPLEWGSNIYKPNAFVFLEVSFLSQFLAMALLIEIIWFQRLWRLAFYTVVMFSTFAGTGLLLAAAAVPLIILRASPRLTGLILAALLVLPPAVLLSGWWDAVAHRVDELNRPNSSGSHRFIAPATELESFYRNPSAIYTGKGAGNILQSPDIVWWSITKVSVEYGLITTLLFHLLFLYIIFVNTPTRRLSAGLLVSFVFLNGSFAVPVNGFICYMLAGYLRPDISIRRVQPGGRWKLLSQLTGGTPAPSAARVS